MVNIEKLRTALKEQNISMDQAADVLCVDRATLYRRFQQGTRFTVEEVDRLSNLLNLSSVEMQSIFFDRELANMRD